MPWPVPILSPRAALGLATAAAVLLAASAAPASAVPALAATGGDGGDVRSWLTTADARALLAPVTGLSWGADRQSARNRVVVDDTVRGQVFRGAGGSLTESSAVVLSRLAPGPRDEVLRRLFSSSEGIGLSLLRQPLGATDFSLGSWTYDDQAPGETDPELLGFSIARDEQHVHPLLRRAAELQPRLGVVVTPWTAPAWMKTSGHLHGGGLDPRHADAYAAYLARAVAEHRAAGIPVRALTLANEPLHAPTSYPSMSLPAAQAIDLAANRLPAALERHGVTDLAVLGYDHNWDDTDYPTALLSDPAGATAFAGVAFHCYAGDPSAQSVVAARAPGHEIWMTECSGGNWSPRFADNLAWNAHTLLIGNLRNAGSSLLLWNLALQPDGGPTNGGCGDCRGVVTVDPERGSVSYNVEYYVLGQLTKAVQPGAVRIGSTSFGAGGIESVAFRNPDGSTAVVLHNNGASKQTARVVDGSRALAVTLPPRAVQTLLW